MLNLKVMMFLCLSVTAVFCEYNQIQLNKNISLKSCLLETNITNDELLAMLSGTFDRVLKILKTHGQKCMAGCMMRKKHLINNGNVSVEVLTSYALNFYGKTENIKRLIVKKVERMANVCAKKDNLPTDECALAEFIVTCMVREAYKAGITNKSGHLVPELDTSAE